jgi:hypothetical protein
MAFLQQLLSLPGDASDVNYDKNAAKLVQILRDAGASKVSGPVSGQATILEVSAQPRLRRYMMRLTM